MADNTTRLPSHPGRSDGGGESVDVAIAGDGLELVFQPIVSLPEEAVVGFEALARWDQFDDRGATLAVLARATATGRQPQLDRLCMHMAIESALAAGFGPDTMLFINSEAVTAHVLRSDDEVLARGADRLQLIFEITERGLLADPPALLSKVAALRADGFAVAFDDVGSNLDSLALLDVICPEIIKLDMALVQSLSRYQQARTWAAVLAHHERAGATILAEGIETDEHLHRAMALGVNGPGVQIRSPGPGGRQSATERTRGPPDPKPAAIVGDRLPVHRRSCQRADPHRTQRHRGGVVAPS